MNSFLQYAGMTPMKGIGVRQNEYPNSMAQAGPICKKAEDLIPFLKVIVGDKISQLKLDDPVDLKSLNIFYQEESGDIRASKMNSAMLNTMKKVVKHLKELTGSATKVSIYSVHIFIRFSNNVISLFHIVID